MTIKVYLLSEIIRSVM